jgi:hypothetical protein
MKLPGKFDGGLSRGFPALEKREPFTVYSDITIFGKILVLFHESPGQRFGNVP